MSEQQPTEAGAPHWPGRPHTRDTGEARVPWYSTHLERRLIQANLGDPLGVAINLAPLAAATGLAPPPNAVAAVVSVEGAPIRYTTTGATPTATVGTLIAAGSVLTITGSASLLAFQAISAGGAATLQGEFYD